MWNKPQLLTGLASVLIAITLGILFYAGVYWFIDASRFPIKRIWVDGHLTHITQQELRYVVQHELKGGFFTLNLDKIRGAFEKLPWVRLVDVQRHWPDRLDVHIQEHHATARWGTDSLLNEVGERFDAASNEALPILEGPEGTEKMVFEGYQQLCDQLKSIEKRPTRVSLSERRAWQVELDHQLTLKIGREHLLERVQRFVAAFPWLLAQWSQPISYVDLRYPNGFAVK